MIALAPELARLRTSGERLQEYPRWIASLGQARAEMQGSAMQGSAQPGRTIEGTFREHMGPILMEEIGARLASAATTPTPFQERLALFWANHFTVSAEKALVFALAQITKASPEKAPSDATIEGAYELFFPGSEAPDEVIEALGDVADQADKALESWRLVLLTLCLSPDWQLL